MNVAFKTQASNPDKPEGMPDAWPWGQVVNLGESTTPPNSDTDWVVMTLLAFEGYKAIHRPAFNAYQNLIKQQEAEFQELDRLNKDRIKFGADLLLKFKQRNISEGIQWFNAIHLHSRIRNWQVTLPAQLGSQVVFVDLYNMLSSGDIETTCLSLIYGQVDDMTNPIHWVTEDRKQWLIDQMKLFLGWP